MTTPATPDSSSYQRIAIVRLSALGDVVMVLPLIHALRRALPKSEITWIIGESVFPLVDGLPGVRFVPIAKPRRLQDYRELKSRFYDEAFDVVFALQASLRTNLIYPLLHAPVKIGYDFGRARDGQWLFTTHRICARREHLVDSFLGFLSPLGICHHEIRWDLPLTGDTRNWARQIRESIRDARLLVVNPAASKPERNWATENYITLLNSVQSDQPVHVVLTSAPNPTDEALCSQIATELRGAVTNLAGKTTPKQLAALLQEADGLLAPDTGPVHIAVAVGTPVIGLYAVAPPELSGPYQHSEWVVNRYPDAVRQILKRNPDQVSWGTRVHDPRAMTLITVAEVRSKLEAVLGIKSQA